MKTPRNTSEHSKLLEIGKTLVGLLEERDIAALELLDSYIEAFSDWEQKILRKRGGLQSGGESRAGRADLAEAGTLVAKQHARVIELAEAMKTQVADSIKSLKLKGKGLKAYSEQYPKRISTIRTRRG